MECSQAQAKEATSRSKTSIHLEKARERAKKKTINEQQQNVSSGRSRAEPGKINDQAKQLFMKCVARACAGTESKDSSNGNINRTATSITENMKSRCHICYTLSARDASNPQGNRFRMIAFSVPGGCEKRLINLWRDWGAVENNS